MRDNTPLFRIYEQAVAASRAACRHARDNDAHEAIQVAALHVMLDLELAQPAPLDDVIRELDAADTALRAAWRPWLCAVAGAYPNLLPVMHWLFLPHGGDWNARAIPVQQLMHVDNALEALRSDTGIDGLGDLKQAVRALYARLDWDERHACRACGWEVEGSCSDRSCECENCGAVNALEAEGEYGGDDGSDGEWWTVRVVGQEVAP